MFTTSIFGEYQQVLIRSDFKGLGFCPIALNSVWFLFVVSSFSFISVCLPLVLEGDISNLAGFTRCMGAINLVGGCCQVRLPTSATCWLWYSSSTYSCRGEREFPFPSIPKNESLWFPFPNYGNGFFHSLPVPEFRECFFFIPFPFPNYGNLFFSFPSHSRIVGMDFFIPFPFPNLPFHRRESKRELEFCERYQTFNIFSFLYIFYNNLYWGGKMSLLVSDWKDREFCSVLLQIVMLQRC